MIRKIAIAILALLVAALLWCAIGNRTASRTAVSEPSDLSPAAIGKDNPTSLPPIAASPEEAGSAFAEAQRAESDEPPRSEQRAFRFVLHDGKLELEAAEDIRGDFHQRRGPVAWESGMLCCRLLDAQKRVLAEETVQAPDRVCVVLDPNTKDPDGNPLPAVLSPKGPAVFQVRLPKVGAATQMRVYRIKGPRPATTGGNFAGQLLATVPLN